LTLDIISNVEAFAIIYFIICNALSTFS